jgi:hypothetical protein
MSVTVLAEALFASHLQPSEVPSLAQVSAAVGDCLRRLGVDGCATAVAREYGEHPETAVRRMRWALGLAAAVAAAETGLLVAA